MKRRGFTLLELLIVLAIIGVVAAILFPIFARRPDGRHLTCRTNLKQIGLAMLQYAQDCDGRLPSIAPVTASSFGWADALQPYLGSRPLIQCPVESNDSRGLRATQSGYTDYWMNTNASRLNVNYFKSPSQTFLCSDGNDGIDRADARYNRSSIPQSWLDDTNSPARRHLDGAEYLFVDSHAKWISVHGYINIKKSGAFHF